MLRERHAFEPFPSTSAKTAFGRPLGRSTAPATCPRPSSPHGKWIREPTHYRTSRSWAASEAATVIAVVVYVSANRVGVVLVAHEHDVFRFGDHVARVGRSRSRRSACRSAPCPLQGGRPRSTVSTRPRSTTSTPSDPVDATHPREPGSPGDEPPRPAAAVERTNTLP
jgi:hypothetical protein